MEQKKNNKIIFGIIAIVIILSIIITVVFDHHRKYTNPNKDKITVEKLQEVNKKVLNNKEVDYSFIKKDTPYDTVKIGMERIDYYDINAKYILTVVTDKSVIKSLYLENKITGEGVEILKEDLDYYLEFEGTI